VETRGSSRDACGSNHDGTSCWRSYPMDLPQCSVRDTLPPNARSYPGGIELSGSPYKRPSRSCCPRFEACGCMVFDSPEFPVSKAGPAAQPTNTGRTTFSNKRDASMPWPALTFDQVQPYSKREDSTRGDQCQFHWSSLGGFLSEGTGWGG
jgi:hypothetical protein